MLCIRGCEDPMATHPAGGPPVLCTWGTSVQPALPVGCAGRMHQGALCEAVRSPQALGQRGEGFTCVK